MVYGGYAHFRTLSSRSAARGPRRLAAWSGLLALVALITLGGVQLAAFVANPARVIRGDLIRAGAEMQGLPWNTPSENVRRAISHAFAQSVTVDPTGFPAHATVTIRHVERDTCVETVRTARRIEGQVVVILRGYSEVTDCGDDNDMTWRLMP